MARDEDPTTKPAPARDAKPGTGAFARDLLTKEQTENATLLKVAIDALESRAEGAERLNKILGGLLVLVVVVFLGREFGVKIPGVGEITTSTTQEAP